MEDQIRNVLIKERVKALKDFREELPEHITGVQARDIVETNWGGALSAVSVNRMRDIANGKIRPRFIILTGPAGVGKSTLAATLSERLFVKNGYSSLEYVTGPELMRSLSFDNMNGDPTKKFVNAGVLMLDDLGVTDVNMTPIRQEGIWTIINSRWGKPNSLTIITTNLQPADVKNIVGTTAWDRMQSTGEIVVMDGKSKRSRR